MNLIEPFKNSGEKIHIIHKNEILVEVRYIGRSERVRGNSHHAACLPRRSVVVGKNNSHTAAS